MRASAGLPCHHPKWPVQCPKCNERADGFNVTIPIERKWDPESKEMRWWAWSTTGMACMRCNAVIIAWPRNAEEYATRQYVEVIVRTDIPGLGDVSFIKASLFNKVCRLPAEEPRDAEVHA